MSRIRIKQFSHKKGIYEGLSGDLEFVLTHEATAQDECIRSGEARRGMTTFLKEREKRKVKISPPPGRGSK